MEHVRIRQHDIRPLPDSAARILRRVSVIREGAQIRLHRFDDSVQLIQLVLGQGLGRKQIHRPRARLGDQTVHNREVVTERLAAGGRSDNHGIFGRRDAPIRFGLMRIRLLDPALAQNFPQFRIEVFGKLAILRVPGGRAPDRSNGTIHIVGQAFEFIYDPRSVRGARRERKVGKQE